MGNNTFIFNLEWHSILLEYPAEVRLEVYEAIMRYATSGTLSELKPLAKMAFSFIKKEMDRNREKYEEAVEKNRKNGRKGGAPKGVCNNPNGRAGKTNRNKPEQTETNPNKPKQTLYDNDNDNEYEHDNDNELSSTTIILGKDEIENIPLPKQKPTVSKHRYAPDVLLTDTEYSSLVSRFGEDGTNWMIEKLDGYKAARGMTYKSDYRAILNWVVKEYQRETNYGRTTTNRQFNQSTPKEQRDAEFASYLATKLGGSDTQT